MATSEQYFELRQKLEETFKTPFCGNIFAHHKYYNSIILQIREQFTKEQVLAYEKLQDNVLAEVRVHNIFEGALLPEE